VHTHGQDQPATMIDAIFESAKSFIGRGANQEHIGVMRTVSFFATIFRQSGKLSEFCVVILLRGANEKMFCAAYLRTEAVWK